MRKLVRIGSNVKIPGDSHYKNKNIVLTLLKKIEMRKMTMLNFCINFLIKQRNCYRLYMISLSHPSRMRGLKLKQEENQILTGHIASLVDAWIKIPILFLYRHCHAVASLADAWIKTGEWKRGWNRGASHPSRMRGLK